MCPVKNLRSRWPLSKYKHYQLAKLQTITDANSRKVTYLCCKGDLNLLDWLCSPKSTVTEFRKPHLNTGWVNYIRAAKRKKHLMYVHVKHMHHPRYTNSEYYNNIYNWFLSSGLWHTDSFPFITVQIKTKRFHGIRQNLFYLSIAKWLTRIELLWKEIHAVP